MAQSKVRTLGMDERSGGEVTISVPRMLLPTDRWTENAADVTREYRVHIEAKMVEIREFLNRHTAAVSIDERQTRYLEALRLNLRNSFTALMATWDIIKSDIVDGNACKEWVIDAEERVNDTLLDSEVFEDIQGTIFLIEQEVRADLQTGPAGSDVTLQEREAADSTLTGLDGLLETSEALTQELGDAEDWIKPTVHPDDVPMLIVSAEESDLYFAKLDGHLGEVTTGEEGIGNRGPVSDSSLGLGPVMTAKEAADTPALLKVFSLGLDLVKEPRTMNGHTPRQLPVVEDVRNDQRLDDRQSPSMDCPNCGAKGDKTHDKDTCPARNKGCFNCGVWGHYGRMCREPRRQLAA